uniref:Uncharacterized protein n=1 Tax=Leersia perrieri TaxID=77586 RepID=A0A0D9VFN4_9ORYZ
WIQPIWPQAQKGRHRWRCHRSIRCPETHRTPCSPSPSGTPSPLPIPARPLYRISVAPPRLLEDRTDLAPAPAASGSGVPVPSLPPLARSTRWLHRRKRAALLPPPAGHASVCDSGASDKLAGRPPPLLQARVAASLIPAPEKTTSRATLLPGDADSQLAPRSLVPLIASRLGVGWTKGSASLYRGGIHQR